MPTSSTPLPPDGDESPASASAAAGTQADTAESPPTVVLAHGAFAESASWDEVVTILGRQDVPVVSVAVPLRGVASDATYLSDLVRTIEGPVVLVGHSYGGAVISSADRTAGDIRGLVYVAGFAPDEGESAATLSGKFPGGTLGETLTVVELTGGGRDLYIDRAKYHQQFCADLPEKQSAQMAAGQRPILEAALTETAGPGPLWRDVPSWFIWGELDRNIPAAVHRFMADRAGARESVQVEGASHVVGISHSARTAELILSAVRSARAAG